jgi:hypothetical protein
MGQLRNRSRESKNDVVVITSGDREGLMSRSKHKKRMAKDREKYIGKPCVRCEQVIKADELGNLTPLIKEQVRHGKCPVRPRK